MTEKEFYDKAYEFDKQAQKLLEKGLYDESKKKFKEGLKWQYDNVDKIED